MPTSNEVLQDLTVNHAVKIQGYARKVADDVAKLMTKLRKDIEAALKDASTDWSKARLERMLTDLNGKISALADDMQRLTQQTMSTFASGEIKVAISALEKATFNLIAIEGVNAAKLVAAATAQPFQGRLMKEWFGGWSQGLKDSMRQQVMIGFVNGEAVSDVAERLIGSVSQRKLIGASAVRSEEFWKKYQRRPNAVLTAERNARTITRTALNHYSNAAHQAVWDANSDVISGLQWLSTLDSRVSEICQALDGTVFPIDDGERPPAHPNCRSVMLPITKSWEELGLKGKDLPTSTRASMDGQVPANLTYSDWLRGHDREFVEDILGPTRAGMFLDQGIPLGRFVTDTGYKLTLAELHDIMPEQFSMASLPGTLELKAERALNKEAIKVWEAIDADEMIGSERDALYLYEHNGYIAINRYLRGELTGTEASANWSAHGQPITNVVKSLRNAFTPSGSATTLENEIVTYRAVNPSTYSRLMQVSEGGVWHDKAFMSTGANLNAVLDYFAWPLGETTAIGVEIYPVMVVRIPAGERVLSVGRKFADGVRIKEQEFILNTQTPIRMLGYEDVQAWMKGTTVMYREPTTGNWTEIVLRKIFVEVLP